MISTHLHIFLYALSILLVLVVALRARAFWSQFRGAATQADELQRLALVAQLTTNAVMITDANQLIVWANDAFGRITGYSPDEVLGQRPSDLLYHERTDAATWARLRAALDRGEGVRAQFLNRRKDGADLWLDLDAQPLLGADGRLRGFVDIATDITERRQAQAELRIAAIAFDSLEAIAITDAEQVILKVNPAFTRVTGYTAEEACGRVTGQLLRSGAHDGAFYAAMWQALERDRHWQGEIWNRRRNGEVYPEWLSITAVADEDNRVTNFVAAFTDITAKKRADELIHRLAFHDPLTELPNRRLLCDRLRQALATSARHRHHVAVLFIDLDHFKALNDSLGHDFGDRLLVGVAQRLLASVRENDTVSRQGGDEFVVLLTDLSESAPIAAKEAEAVTRKLRAAIDRPFDLGGAQWHCTPSIGTALGFGHESTVDELLKRADIAMYEAKHAARIARSPMAVPLSQ